MCSMGGTADSELKRPCNGLTAAIMLGGSAGWTPFRVEPREIDQVGRWLPRKEG